MQNKSAKANRASFTSHVAPQEEQMERTFAFVLLLLSWATTSSKYIYINRKMTWFEARDHCREHYTDLAHASNQNDNRRLKEMQSQRSWIGLHRDDTHRDKWRWSGGGEVPVLYWGYNQPEERNGEDYGMLYRDGWHDDRPGVKATLLCFNPIVVEERKTWEEAMGYCRQHHRDLASLLSETEMMLIGKALLKTPSAERVWIGLHFFSGKWLWVDSETSEYKAWGQHGEPACPNPKQVCAALQMESNSTVAHPEVDSTDSDSAVVATVPGKWEACNCDDRLPFICY